MTWPQPSRAPYHPSPHGQPERPPLPPHRPGARRFSWLLVTMTVVLGLGAAVVAGMIIRLGAPGATGLGILLAALPVPMLLWFYLWLDRNEPEPRSYLITGFAWGAVAATTLGVVFTLAGSRLTGSGMAETGYLWAPLAEEFAKGLFLLGVFWLRRRHLGGIVDGIVYAGMVGIGFAFTENILYYVTAYTDVGTGTVGGIQATTALFVARGVISPLAHPLFTSLTGIGFGIAVGRRGTLGRVLPPLLGYAAAATLHGTWNAAAMLGGPGAFVAIYLVGMLPALLLVLFLALWQRRREVRVLRRALADCARLGWLHPAEIPWLALPRYRQAAAVYADRVAGQDGARAFTEYRHAMAEMGFLHDRVMRGPAPPDAGPRMAEIRQRAAAWRPYVVLPPPLPVTTG